MGRIEGGFHLLKPLAQLSGFVVDRLSSSLGLLFGLGIWKLGGPGSGTLRVAVLVPRLVDAFHVRADFFAPIFADFRMPIVIALFCGIKKLAGLDQFFVGSIEISEGFLFQTFLPFQMAF